MKKQMKKVKRVLLTALAIVLLLTCVACDGGTNGVSSTGGGSSAATGGTESTGNSEPAGTDNSEVLTIDFFSSPGNFMGTQTGWYAKLIKDKFNIELNIISPNVAGGGETLYQTRSAAGDLGDIIVISKTKMKDCIDAGLLMDISDYIPNSRYLKNFQLAIDGLKDYLETDAVYGIPTNSSLESSTTPSFYGTDPYDATYVMYDLYEEVGAPDLATYDDLLDTLKQMQEKRPANPDGGKTYGFSFFKDWDGNYMKEANCLVRTLGYTQDGIGFLSVNGDGTNTQPFDEDGGVYYQALQILFKANQMGLIDPDSSSQSWDDYVAKVKSGSVLFSTWPWASISHYNNTDSENEGTGFAFVPVTECKYYTDGYNPYGADSHVMAIGSNCEEVDRVLGFLDWYASPENTNCFDGCMGPQGVLWDIIDGEIQLTTDGEAYMADVTGFEAPEELGGGNFAKGSCQTNTQIQFRGDKNPETGEGYYYSAWTTTVENGRTALDEKWTDRYGAQNPQEMLENGDQMEISPGSSYGAPQEATEITTKRTACQESIVNASWKMVFASDEAEFEQIWKNMQAELVGLGYEDCLEVDYANAELYKAAKTEALKG